MLLFAYTGLRAEPDLDDVYYELTSVAVIDFLINVAYAYNLKHKSRGSSSHTLDKILSP